MSTPKVPKMTSRHYITKIRDVMGVLMCVYKNTASENEAPGLVKSLN